MLVGLIWLTYFLFNLGSARGSLLVLYLLVLMFAVFLPPKIFIRYASWHFSASSAWPRWTITSSARWTPRRSRYRPACCW